MGETWVCIDGGGWGDHSRVRQYKKKQALGRLPGIYGIRGIASTGSKRGVRSRRRSSGEGCARTKSIWWLSIISVTFLLGRNSYTKIVVTYILLFHFAK